MICSVSFEWVSVRDPILQKWLWKAMDMCWLCHACLHKPQSPEVSNGRIGTTTIAEKQGCRSELEWAEDSSISPRIVLHSLVYSLQCWNICSHTRIRKRPTAGPHPSEYGLQKQVVKDEHLPKPQSKHVLCIKGSEGIYSAQSYKFKIYMKKAGKINLRKISGGTWTTRLD